jgi:HEAT repeat protein
MCRRTVPEALTILRRWSAFSTLAGLLILSIAAGKSGAAQDSAPWITDDQQQQIVRRIRTVLPGWTITQTSLNRTPDDWYTLDNRGFEIDGRNGERAFQIWFVPKDWLGIRQSRANRMRLVYWEGVLMGQDFKTITNTDQVSVLEAILKLDMRTPSLVNSGWYEAEKLFKDRMSEVDSRAQTLVNRFCKDQSCRDEAAYSLIVLGVPARTITLDCAEHARQDAQGFCVSTLGYMGGQDAARTLGNVVSNPLTSPQVQKYAAMSLKSIADPSAGPALLKALRTISWPEAAAQVAEALGRIHYELAAPEILSRMKKEHPGGVQQAYYARSLASLRYQPAVPAIEKLCQTTRLSGDWFLKEQQGGRYLGDVPEIALLRLTAAWGAPSEGIRLLLLPLEGSGMPGRVRAVAVIENVGDRDRNILGPPGGDAIVDGTRHQHKISVVMDGDCTLRVNDVRGEVIDLSDVIVDGGIHRVEYQLGAAHSNQLTLGVPRSKR